MVAIKKINTEYSTIQKEVSQSMQIQLTHWQLVSALHPR